MKIERTTVKPEFKPIVLTITLETHEEVESLKRVTNNLVTAWRESDARIAERIHGELS